MTVFMGEDMKMNANKAMALSYQGARQEAHVMAGFDSCELHTTLPLRELIGLFEIEVRDFVTYDSFEYEHARNGIHLFRGTPKLHKCQYRIHTSGLELGQLTLTRRRPFEEREILLIERALGALIIHLKNAVDYQARLDEEQLTALKVDALVGNH